GCQRHEDRLRYLSEADSMRRPLFPDTKSHPPQPYARTRCKPKVKWLTLALSTRICPQGRPRLVKRSASQTTPREFPSNTFNERCGRRGRDCAKGYDTWPPLRYTIRASPDPGTGTLFGS